MDEMLDRIAERAAKKITKDAMKKVSKIVYKAVLESVKEGWLSYKGIDDKDFCKTEEGFDLPLRRPLLFLFYYFPLAP